MRCVYIDVNGNVDASYGLAPTLAQPCDTFMTKTHKGIPVLVIAARPGYPVGTLAYNVIEALALIDQEVPS